MFAETCRPDTGTYLYCFDEEAVATLPQGTTGQFLRFFESFEGNVRVGIFSETWRSRLGAQAIDHEPRKEAPQRGWFDARGKYTP